MDDEPAVDRPSVRSRARQLGWRRAAVAGALGVAGFAWAALAFVVGNGPLPVFAMLAIAAIACLGAAYGLLAFKRWAVILATIAFLGSLGLAYVVYLAIRSAFATYPF